MYDLDTLSVLVADRRREREAAAASRRLAITNPARRRAAGTLRRLADRIDTPRVAAPQPGLGTGRGNSPRPASASLGSRPMATFLHTMVRITDPDRSRRFYEALGFRFARDMDIVRDGQLEATNYFFSLGDAENVLELTYNHDGRTYELGTGYGHIAIGVDDLDGTLTALAEQGIEPERPPYQVREGGSFLCFVRDPDDYRIELIGA